MTPRERLTASFRALDPLEQGNLDSLCGLYAVLNALRLAGHPYTTFTRPQLQALFEHGVRELHSRRQLRDTLLHGIPLARWLLMARAVVARAAHLTGHHFTLQPARPDDFLTAAHAVRAIRHGIHRGAPVLLGLEGRLDHWTVVARYSRARLTLFDSAKHRWVPTAAVGLARDNVPHGIVPCAILILRPP